MSRSSLAARFKDIVGETPMKYVTRWRILKAQELLTATGYPLSEIAERVGYKSESAFSYTFKRQIGKSPGVFRRLMDEDK